MMKFAFIENYLSIFFSEEKLLRYAENNFHLKFTPNKVSYTKLYKDLRLFIDYKILNWIVLYQR